MVYPGNRVLRRCFKSLQEMEFMDMADNKEVGRKFYF
jgi:hypothetical protein